MRIEGKIKKWNDDRGFGFIEPVNGAPEIFFHIKAYYARGKRPEIGEQVVFDVEIKRDGKRHASMVHPVSQQPGKVVSKTGRRSNRWQPIKLFAVPVFMLFFLFVAFVWNVPGWIFVLYLLMSAIAFLLYASDKQAALTGEWRTPESTLIFIGITGGWPGAIIAQQLFRHKSTKNSFQSAFWGSVVINVVAFAILCTPLARAILDLLVF